MSDVDGLGPSHAAVRRTSAARAPSARGVLEHDVRKHDDTDVCRDLATRLRAAPLELSPTSAVGGHPVRGHRNPGKLPTGAGQSFSTSVRDPGTLSLWVGLAVMAAWVAAAVVVGLRRRDA